MEDIQPKNHKRERHGYQQYHTKCGKIWLRGYFKNEQPIGYQEYNLYSNITSFHIR